jgi:hypothetical protein
MPQLKGSGWLVNFDYIKENHGPDAMDKVLNAMSLEDREILSKPMVAASWGPEFAIFMRFILTADKVLGTGDHGMLPKAAAYHFERDTKLYALFFKILTTEFMLKSIPKIWRQYFNPPGELVPQMIGEKHVHICLKNFPGMPIHHEKYHQIYMYEILRKTNCKNIKMSHSKCIGRGDDQCVFDARWE